MYGKKGTEEVGNVFENKGSLSGSQIKGDQTKVKKKESELRQS